MTAISGFRLAAGTLSPAALDDTYDIENWQRQSDMPPGRDWLRPDNLADVVEEVAEVVDSFSLKRGGYGRPHFRWMLRNLTSGMVQYVMVTFFPGGAYSAPVTVRTYNRATGTFQVYTATMTRKRYGDGGAEPGAGAYDNLLLEFWRAQRVDRAFGSAFSSAFG